MTPGRKFSTVTPLGQMMHDAGLRVSDVDYITGISYRTLSDYLAGRKTIPQRHLTKLCAMFQCEAEAFDFEPSPVGSSAS